MPSEEWDPRSVFWVDNKGKKGGTRGDLPKFLLELSRQMGNRLFKIEDVNGSVSEQNKVRNLLRNYPELIERVDGNECQLTDRGLEVARRVELADAYEASLLEKLAPLKDYL